MLLCASQSKGEDSLARAGANMCRQGRIPLDAFDDEPEPDPEPEADDVPIRGSPVGEGNLAEAGVEAVRFDQRRDDD